jgi:hypothetical protein
MNSKAKWFFGILGSLVLGALGSGLWNGVFSPIFSALGRLTMSLLTLGYSSARDGVYEQAAKGLYEKPSVMVLEAVTMIIIIAPILAYIKGRNILKRRDSREEFRRKPAEEQRKLVEELDVKLLKLGRLLFWTTAISVCASTILIIQIIFIGYTNTVIGRFSQEIAIITPDITEQQRQVYQSRFASMKTRAEFVSLLQEVNKTAEAHGKPKSGFIPW